jgi:hypothetical protein
MICLLFALSTLHGWTHVTVSSLINYSQYFSFNSKIYYIIEFGPKNGEITATGENFIKRSLLYR